MLIEFVEPDFSFDNEAGTLRQLVHEGWSQINVVTSVAGAYRGGHHHNLNKELFYVVSGSFFLEVSGGNEQEKYEMKAGDMFIIPPYVDHTFEYLEDTVLVGMYDKGVELKDGSKDIISQSM